MENGYVISIYINRSTSQNIFFLLLRHRNKSRVVKVLTHFGFCVKASTLSSSVPYTRSISVAIQLILPYLFTLGFLGNWWRMNWCHIFEMDVCLCGCPLYFIKPAKLGIFYIVIDKPARIESREKWNIPQSVYNKVVHK